MGRGGSARPAGAPVARSEAHRRLDRFRGALLGLAVGDAMGVPVEGLGAGAFRPVEGLSSSPAAGLPSGAWSDDTAMALCLAESLIARRGFDAADQMGRYVAWLEKGHLTSTGYAFGIGATVYRALTRFMETGEPFSGSPDPMTAGNGCLMRLAPIPLFFAEEPGEAVRLAAESARTTHGARTCLDACRYFAGLILGALDGVPREDLLAPRFGPLPGLWDEAPLCPEVDQVAAGAFLGKEPPEIRATGYVVDTLEAALWAFARADGFADGMLRAVNLGGDTDTVGAVYGQLAGAYYGAGAIPKEWREGVARHRDIAGFAERLAARA